MNKAFQQNSISNLNCITFPQDLSWITGQLAVSRCFPPDYVAELAGTHGIGAVIDLRGESSDDENELARHDIAFLHLPTPDALAARQNRLDQGVVFAREHMRSGGRVLIHCQYGIGRSALLALCVLVDLGYKPLAALSLAKNRRAAVSPSHDQYLGWAEWLRRHGHDAPDAHSFGCIAYRHLA